MTLTGTFSGLFAVGSDVVGVLLPLIASTKAVVQRDERAARSYGALWLGLLLCRAVEQLCSAATGVPPLPPPLRFAAVAWLAMPQTHGALHVYRLVFAPLFKTYEARGDAAIGRAAKALAKHSGAAVGSVFSATLGGGGAFGALLARQMLAGRLREWGLLLGIGAGARAAGGAAEGRPTDAAAAEESADEAADEGAEALQAADVAAAEEPAADEAPADEGAEDNAAAAEESSDDGTEAGTAAAGDGDGGSGSDAGEGTAASPPRSPVVRRAKLPASPSRSPYKEAERRASETSAVLAASSTTPTAKDMPKSPSRSPYMEAERRASEVRVADATAALDAG